MGQINVNIPKQNRLEAINNLSKAIYEVSKALTTPTQVNITGCTLENNGTGISVDTSDIERTEVISIDLEE